MSQDTTYEYAEVVVGFFNRGQGVAGLLFLHVRDIRGDKTTPDFADGPLGALNLMGAQGWKLLSQQEATPGRMGWVWASLRRHDAAIDPEQYLATEFLMMRHVRD